jgi:magnesium chelatase subunit I
VGGRPVRAIGRSGGDPDFDRTRPLFPFTAIVGQEELKLALILNAIDPSIGGALIMGHRGTGKSTAVRALAGLLPDLVHVKGCPYACDPESLGAWCAECYGRRRLGKRPPVQRARPRVVELPLGATEDRVCGSLDIERALRDGQTVFRPGLLALANRGFLYIDEVNLLEDHIVDLLLDVAASGWNLVEREGVSVAHPARFVLIGSGNPEEGELRPQLLDRFGLHVKITTVTEIAERVEIAERRDRFDRSPRSFLRDAEPQERVLRLRLAVAGRSFAAVAVSREITVLASELCVRLAVDGHRGEITLVRAARALAALEERSAVDPFDLRRVAPMSLRHRLRKDPFGATDEGPRIERAMDQILPEVRANGAA